MISEKSGSGTLPPPGEFAVSRRTGQDRDRDACPDRVLHFAKFVFVETEIPDIKVFDNREGVTDFGITTRPLSRCQRIQSAQGFCRIYLPDRE